MVNKKILIGSLIGIIAIGSLIFGAYLILTPESPEPQLWSENPTLDSPIESSWFWEYGTEGDISDIGYSISSDHVNYRVLGEKKTVTLLYGAPNSSSSPGWGIFNNSGLLPPDNSLIRSEGCWVYHYLDEGEDFTSLFRAGINISISIQIYIANTFGLNRTITVSIDNVYLYISYINIKPEEDLSPLVIGLTAGIIGIVVAFSLYQGHFKYPPLVRKIRKLKKRVKRGKVKKLILVNKREDIIKHNLNNRKIILILESTQHDQVEKIEKISI